MVKLHKYTSKKLIFIVKKASPTKLKTKLQLFFFFFLDLCSRFFLLPKKQRTK